MKKILRQRTVKFLIGGGIAAALNLVLITVMIDQLGFNTPLLRNVANMVSIELSLLFSFFVYWVW